MIPSETEPPAMFSSSESFWSKLRISCWRESIQGSSRKDTSWPRTKVLSCSKPSKTKTLQLTPLYFRKSPKVPWEPKFNPSGPTCWFPLLQRPSKLSNKRERKSTFTWLKSCTWFTDRPMTPDWSEAWFWTTVAEVTTCQRLWRNVSFWLWMFLWSTRKPRSTLPSTSTMLTREKDSSKVKGPWPTRSAERSASSKERFAKTESLLSLSIRRE